MNQEYSKKQPITEIKAERTGGLGLITLNRPAALNALNLEMIRQISGTLREWERDPAVKAVMFHGAGDRAFCAGGDLKLFHQTGMSLRKGLVDLRVPAVFFGEEYSLNRQIFHYPKPTIAFMNGITMGGGYGIAGNTSLRIATERTVFAMPEVGIGFFPDVGSVYHLLRCPDFCGHYLALTGARLAAHDVVHAGLADYFMPLENEINVLEQLQKPDLSPEVIRRAVDSFSVKKMPTTEFSLAMPRIARIFEKPEVLNIFGLLARDGSDWARATFDLMRSRSPSSVMVTAEYLSDAVGLEFNEVLRTDFTLAQRFIERMDLYEGIRAILIDKDNAPSWNPAAFEEILSADIRRYFIPTGYELDDVQIFEPDVILLT